MSVSEMLRGLPSHNENNFSRFHSEGSRSTIGLPAQGNRIQQISIPKATRPSKKPAVYLPTKDFPSEQVITTEKTNILLRYLHQQWDKKNNQKKRDTSSANMESDTSPARKIPRLDSTSGNCG